MEKLTEVYCKQKQEMSIQKEFAIVFEGPFQIKDLLHIRFTNQIGKVTRFEHFSFKTETVLGGTSSLWTALSNYEIIVLPSHLIDVEIKGSQT